MNSLWELLHVNMGSFAQCKLTPLCIPTPGGVRRARGVRGRVTAAASSEGLRLTELLSSGVRADILQTLLPREERTEAEGEGGRGQLIQFNQVIMRGEDVTG